MPPNRNFSPKVENPSQERGSPYSLHQKQRDEFSLQFCCIPHPSPQRPRHGGRCARRAARQRGANLVHWTWKRLKANLFPAHSGGIFREFVHLRREGESTKDSLENCRLETVDVSWGKAGRQQLAIFLKVTGNWFTSNPTWLTLV